MAFLEAKTFKEFIGLAKSKPNEFNYTSSGNGSSVHLPMEMLKQQAGIDLTHVPYKGGAPALTDLMGGQVPVMFVNQDAASPHVKAGKLNALAVANTERNPLYPDTPTIAESGYPGCSAVSWFGLSAPAKTPRAIIEKLHAATVKALQSPEFKDRIVNNGFVVVGNTPEEFTAFGREREMGQGHQDGLQPARVRPTSRRRLGCRQHKNAAGAGDPARFGSMEEVG